MNAQVIRLHAKGAPFPISGKNGLLLVPRKWRLLYRDYGAVGVEMKKGIRREQLKQAKMKFLLWASASQLPFCQVSQTIGSVEVMHMRVASLGIALLARHVHDVHTIAGSDTHMRTDRSAKVVL